MTTPALTTAPLVRFGPEGGTWHQSEWSLDTPADVAIKGDSKMTPRDVRYLNWKVTVAGGEAQVFRVLVAGADVPAGDLPPGAIVLPVGKHVTYSKVIDMPEVVESKTGTVTVA